MANIIAHDNAIYVDAEDKTLDKVLKQTKEDITATATAVASADNLANVKIGDNINVTEDGTISVLLATNNEHGVIIPGIGLNINNQTPGQLDISIGEGLEATYQGDMSVKKATTNSLGGIKVGNGLTVNNLGVLSIPVLSGLSLSSTVPEGFSNYESYLGNVYFLELTEGTIDSNTKLEISGAGAQSILSPIVHVFRQATVQSNVRYNVYLHPDYSNDPSEEFRFIVYKYEAL